MKKVFKYVSMVILVIFSFYYTNMVSNIYIDKSSLMLQINRQKAILETKSVNAIITDNYIIPGLNGLIIDSKSSYNAMKEHNTFDVNLIVLKEIIPKNSYNDHLDLIINKGNYLKKGVSIIINNNKNIVKYALDNSIKINVLVDKNSIMKSNDVLQINNDYLHYEEVDKILDKEKINFNICIINDNNYDTCKSYGKYLVKPSIILNNNSINQSLSAGDIIYLSDDYSLVKFKLLLKQIEYNRLKVIFLDDMISESLGY